MTVELCRSSSCPSRSPSSTHVREFFVQRYLPICLSISISDGHALHSSCLQCVVYRGPCVVVALPLLGMLDDRPCGAGTCSASHATHDHTLSELGANFHAPSLSSRTLITAFSLQFAPKNLLASSVGHLPMTPSGLSRSRTPRPARTNTAQMAGFLHSLCRPGLSNRDPLSISATDTRL